MKQSVAKLQKENRSMEDRLVQEQIDNGDLTARLDDARNLLSDRGIDPDVRVGSHRGRDAGVGSFADKDGPPTRTLPAGQRDAAAAKTPVCPDLRSVNVPSRRTMTTSRNPSTAMAPIQGRPVDGDLTTTWIITRSTTDRSVGFPSPTEPAMGRRGSASATQLP